MSLDMDYNEEDYELTEEDLEENEKIAQKAWDAIKDDMKTRNKKKGGDHKGKSDKAAGVNKDLVQDSGEITDMTGKEDDKPMHPMDVKIPDAVRNLCVNRIEELEKLMQDINARIEELKGISSSYESEYKVIADYVFRKTT